MHSGWFFVWAHVTQEKEINETCFKTRTKGKCKQQLKTPWIWVKFNLPKNSSSNILVPIKQPKLNACVFLQISPWHTLGTSLSWFPSACTKPLVAEAWGKTRKVTDGILGFNGKNERVWAISDRSGIYCIINGKYWWWHVSKGPKDSWV